MKAKAVVTTGLILACGIQLLADSGSTAEKGKKALTPSLESGRTNFLLRLVPVVIYDKWVAI